MNKRERRPMKTRKERVPMTTKRERVQMTTTNSRIIMARGLVSTIPKALRARGHTNSPCRPLRSKPRARASHRTSNNSSKRIKMIPDKNNLQTRKRFNRKVKITKGRNSCSLSRIRG